MSSPIDRQETLFATALVLPADERSDFLARECGDDGELQQRIERLLRAHDEAGDLLEPPAEMPLSELQLAPVPLVLPGARIGRYTLLEKIGEGGCGSVYLAEQTDLVRRRVALKIVKLGMDTREVIARFEAERHALALMDHPNIARVFDAGATDTGRPYFAMEFVPGTKITEYCELHQCSIAERLGLFVQVCHAIQHAHHKGVIHRDIKPSNILITRDEPGAPGVPKVIDFGIAKATQGRLTEHTLTTACEQFIGTPVYVSPEQAEASERDIDTRSDVYSLGMLLYELLAGRTPFESKELVAGGLSEMRRQICEVEPPRPSAQLRRLDAEAQGAIARSRHTSGPELLKALDGDLDWIVMRCLEKDRARRYQTALGLARDVQRHLDHQPVDASPPSLYYTFRKFARRHRGALAAGAAIVVMLVAATAISLQMALAARQAEKRAENEAAAAKQAIAFLQNDLFAPVSSENLPVWDLKLRTVLDRANQSLDGRFTDQPLVEASLRETLAGTYHALGEYATEQRHWEKALALRRRLHGPEAAETLHVTGRLAAAYESLGRYGDAERLARSNVEVHHRVLGAEDAATLRSKHRLASILWNQGRTTEAVALHKETLHIRSRVLGLEHPDTLSSMQDVAQVQRGLGELMTAANWGARVLEVKTRVFGAQHPDTLAAKNSLAMTLRAQGKLAESEQLHRDTLELRTRVLGPEHPDTLASMTNLAFVQQDQGRLEEAEKTTAQTLEIKRRTLGAEHPSTLNSMSILAIIRLAQNRGAEAAELHAAVLEVRQRLLGDEHPDTLISMHYLGAAYRARGDLPEAATLLTATLELRRRVLAAKHSDTLRTMEELGHVFLQQKKFAEAEELLQEAIKSRNWTTHHAWRTALVRGLLGEALLGQGRISDAEFQFQLAYKGLSQPSDGMPVGGEPIVRDAGERLLHFYLAQGKPYKAEEMRRRLAATQ